MNKLQRISWLQKLIVLSILAQSLPIVFSEFTPDVLSRLSFSVLLNEISMGAYFQLILSLLSIIYFFIGTTLVLPILIITFIPASMFFVEMVKPILWVVWFHTIALLLYPIYYYKYKDVYDIININRVLSLTAITWTGLIGIIHFVYPETAHYYAPMNLSGFSILSNILLLIGPALIMINKTFKIGISFVSIGCLIWFSTDNRYIEVSNLFLFLSFITLFVSEKSAKFSIFCLRKTFFKFAFIAVLIIPVLGFESPLKFIHEFIPLFDSRKIAELPIISSYHYFLNQLI